MRSKLATYREDSLVPSTWSRGPLKLFVQLTIPACCTTADISRLENQHFGSGTILGSVLLLVSLARVNPMFLGRSLTLWIQKASEEPV